MSLNAKPQTASPAKLRVVAIASIVVWSVSFSAAAAEGTLVGIDGSRFTLNGTPTFLLGVSYYGALGAPEEFVRRDLDDVQRYGFNWLRVWATWESLGDDVSAVDSRGQPRQPFMDKLKWLVGECDRRGLVVDVTLTRGKGSSRGDCRWAFARLRVASTGGGIRGKCPESNIATGTSILPMSVMYVMTGTCRQSELKTLRKLLRRLDPSRLATASFGGHDLNERDMRDGLLTAELDFLAPHRPRNPESPAQTEARTRECLAQMKQIGRVVPVLHQEPFRRGYTAWEPAATDFLTDLRGAVAGEPRAGAFITERKATRRTRSLAARLISAQSGFFDQLDTEERKVVTDAAALVR